jgi:hypothetical protein
MRYYRFGFVALATASVLAAAACAGTPGTAVKLANTGGTGASGGNGLLPEVYFGTFEETDRFMQTVPRQIAPAQYQRLRDRAERIGEANGNHHGQGDRLLQDIIGCALKPTESLPVDRSIHGEGLMTPDADAGAPWQPLRTHWPGDIFDDAGARVSRREDIHTCLMARLNPTAIKVPIFLSGPHATPGGDPRREGFPYREAVWLVTIEAPGPAGVPAVHLDVWPLQQLASCTDQGKTDTLLGTRICGTLFGAPQCGLTPHRHADLEKHCKKVNVEDGIWSCCDPRGPCTDSDRRPAVETHLGPCGWTKLYPACSLPSATDLSQCGDPSAL